MPEQDPTSQLKINMPEKYSEKWLKAKMLIMKDTQEEFTVDQINGLDMRKVVVLKSLNDGHTVTKNFIELIGNIKTPGSPWSVKE